MHSIFGRTDGFCFAGDDYDDDAWPARIPYSNRLLSLPVDAHTETHKCRPSAPNVNTAFARSYLLLTFTVKWASIIVIINQSIQRIYPFTLVKHNDERRDDVERNN